MTISDLDSPSCLWCAMPHPDHAPEECDDNPDSPDEPSALEIVQAQLRATQAEMRDVVTENARLRAEVARLTAPEALDRLSFGKGGSFDELVASHVAVHLEMLDRGEAYLNIYRAEQQEKFAQVFLRADGDVLRVVVEDYGVWQERPDD